MRRTQARSVVAVEILIEQDVISPVRILLELGRAAVDGAMAVLVPGEDRDHPLGDLAGHAVEGDRLAVRPGVAGEGRAERLAQSAERLDQEEARREPDRASPVRVPPLDLADGLGRLISDGVAGVLKRVRLVGLREAADPVRRQEFGLLPHPLGDPLELRLVQDRQGVGLVIPLVNRVHDVRHLLLAVLEEPVQVGAKILELVDPALFEPLDGEQGDQADERPDAELVVAAVGVAEDVVEEAVGLVPEGVVAVAHVLHGRRDVGVVLEELGRERLVDAVLLGEFEGDPHQVEAEHPHPAGGVGLFQHGAVGGPHAAVDDRDVVQAEEPSLEDAVALAVDLVDPPGEVDQQLVEALLQPGAVGLARADAVHVVDAPDGPGVDRRVEVGELPLISGDLSVGVLELLEKQ